ncbi:hypothetical protein B4U80_06950 [Leptotrombidium deliense]|uniref:Acetylserotonin O-methyltransferase n=1 Tax=Leptotrombidium deliense TaxID=299467 RepID=A0A443SIJ5_9ACAR|nr:hypothetical protein B4U80_06950 [Leptotrombidium deliense]
MMSNITCILKPCLVYCAAKLDIADHLREKSLTVNELASVTNTDNISLYRLLRALSMLGIVIEKEEQLFSLTPLGETLRSDVKGSVRSAALSTIGDLWPVWGQMLHTVRTGETAFDSVFGVPFWEYCKQHTIEAQNLISTNMEFTELVAKQLASSYDFTKYKRIIDIGGGNGSLLVAILEEAPNAQGIVFEEGYVLQKAKELIEKSSVKGRCKTVSGNFLKSIPANGDCYILKNILLNWKDEDAILILKNVRSQMNKGSVLLIIQSLVPEGNQPHPGKIHDVIMMSLYRGKERTRKQTEFLLQSAGLKITNVVKTEDPISDIIEVQIV